MDGGGGVGGEVSVFPAVSAIHHPLPERKSIFLSLVLSPNVLNLEKKEQTLTNAYCFPNINAAPLPPPRRCHPSSRLPGCRCRRPGRSATTAVGADGAHEVDCWPPLEVTWLPKKQILGNFSQEEHLQLKALLAFFPRPLPAPHTARLFGK